MLSISIAFGQGAKRNAQQSSTPASDADHPKLRNEWFYRGRVIQGLPSAELRRRAYQAKLALRQQRTSSFSHISGQVSFATGSWTALGPVPLASDATGNGTQNYNQVAGRATAVALDPADSSGNTVYIGGAQSGIWKSANAAASTANDVVWTPISDDQATLSIGSIAIQPGNTNPASTVILAATGEANNSADSYFGLGILRSADAGSTWTLINSANNGSLSFSGLGGTRMAFSTAINQMNTVVSAMATSSEGMVDGAVTTGTTRGLYTSLDAGQTWTYDALTDPGGATDATSATSVVYNSVAGLFFAAVRYHGFYSSPDGVNWTRLAAQPGGSVLSATACPPQSISNNYACPIYRGEITVVPGRNEMYVWYVYLTENGTPADAGIWQSLNSGASWTQISDTGITSCGDFDGCGVQQGDYNLELLAVPYGAATDLYAGAVNLYKCTISTLNPTCASTPFMNLTHVYGCVPIAAPSHVHPDQHALAYMIPVGGSDSGNELLYFANDGGIYRALNGFTGLTSGSCSAINQFDDLNQNLGSMTQFVSFSQHPSDPNTLLGGTQDNGSPATGQATTNSSWGNVLGGDGGYNAIDPLIPTNFYASNPDVPPGGLGIQLCASGVNCNDSGFEFVVTSSTLGGDDGAFYFPYILDPGSATSMLVGTCRIWRGPRTGGVYTVLSPNFDTLGSSGCLGNEVNQVQAIAAAGTPDSNGSTVIYATTSGLGPLNGPSTSPSGGHVWVTTNATGGSSYFTDVTGNGPQGSLNPNQYPISGVATDGSDASGQTAYVTVMGFTGGPGHVWKTTNAGSTWTDFTANLPDSPANAVVVYPALSQVFVATDVGVFASLTSSPNWTELGPEPASNQSGFLPNVAVTALSTFNSGGQQLLRASTYGRGIWQFNLVTTPDFQLLISNSPQSISVGQTANFTGTASALNGYASSVSLTCVAGVTPPPPTCTPSPSALTPGINTPFTVTAGGTAGDYYFNVQGVGSDSNHDTHQVGAVLHITGSGPDFALTETGSFPTVNVGSTSTTGPINVTATGGFTGTITLTCSMVSGNGSCGVNPNTVTSIPSTPIVNVNATSLVVGSYQIVITGTSGSITHTLLIPFNVGDYSLSGQESFTAPVAGQGTDSLTVTASTYYTGRINATCNASSLPGATSSTCSLSPVNPVFVNTGAAVPLTATIAVPASAPAGNYNISINTQDTTGTPSHNITVSLAVQDFTLNSSTSDQTVAAGQTSSPYGLTIQPASNSFNYPVNLSCSGLPAGAQCVFSPSSTVTPGSATSNLSMSIVTASSTAAGTYAIAVVGSSGALSHTTSISLIVTNTGTVTASDFQLAVTQAFPSNTDAGTSDTAKLSITPNYTGSVNATCDHSSISASQCVLTPANPIPITPNVPATVTATLNLPNDAMPGSYTITVTIADVSGQPTHSLQFPLVVNPDFSLTSATPSQTVTAGQTTGAYQLTIAPNPPGASFPGAVVLSCTNGLPQGAQCLFSPSTPQTPGNTAVSVVMTISTAASSAESRLPSRRPWFSFAFWFLPGLVVIAAGSMKGNRLRHIRVVSLLACLLLLAGLLSCAGVSSAGSGTGTTSTGTAATYQVTVTGTSPGTAPDPAQSTVVTLVVN